MHGPAGRSTRGATVREIMCPWVPFCLQPEVIMLKLAEAQKSSSIFQTFL